MIIVAEYSFNDGNSIKDNHSILLDELKEIISEVDAVKHKTKISKEPRMQGKKLYSPKKLNKAFKDSFNKRCWHSHREQCTYKSDYYLPGHKPTQKSTKAYREMDFVKMDLGVEVQLGKYAFMVYNVCAKMTIFRNLNIINAGIEIVPVKSLADEMSSGVSYFEQIVWDLETRGVADIDIPVLIFGIDAN